MDIQDCSACNEFRIHNVADTCPKHGICKCGQIEDRDILDSLGECLTCDKVRGDVEAEMREDIEERGDDGGRDEAILDDDLPDRELI